jgi:hypothetical protein
MSRANLKWAAAILLLVFIVPLIVVGLLWREMVTAKPLPQVIPVLGTKQIDGLFDAFGLPAPKSICTVNAIMEHHDVDGILRACVVFDLSELKSWRQQTSLQDSNEVSRSEINDGSGQASSTDWWTSAVRGSDKAYVLRSNEPTRHDDRFAVVHINDDKVYLFLYRSALDSEFPAAFMTWFRTNPKPVDYSFMPIPGHAATYEKKWP